MKTVLFVYFALMIISLSGCQKGSGQASVAGMNACINNPSACNTSAYQQNQGYVPYNYNNSYNYGYNNYNYNQPFNYINNTAYLCNCPNGTMPTYNSYSGLGCVRSASTQAAYGYFYYYMGWNANQWYTTPYLNTYSYNQSTCYNGVVQSCLVNSSTNMCPAGYTCRANSASNTLGLCTAAYR